MLEVSGWQNINITTCIRFLHTYIYSKFILYAAVARSCTAKSTNTAARTGKILK